MEPVDGLAYIGRNPMDDDNVYIVTGDSGNGMTHGTLAGMLIPDLILVRANPWADALRTVTQERARRRYLHRRKRERRRPHDQGLGARRGGSRTVEEIPCEQGAILRQLASRPWPFIAMPPAVARTVRGVPAPGLRGAMERGWRKAGTAPVMDPGSASTAPFSMVRHARRCRRRAWPPPRGPGARPRVEPILRPTVVREHPQARRRKRAGHPAIRIRTPRSRDR